jgi:uncharacterized integral membrane protein
MVRLIIGVILGIITVIFAAQNTDTVTYTFLAWSLAAPRAVIVLVVLIAGMVIGWVSTGFRGLRRKKKQS